MNNRQNPLAATVVGCLLFASSILYAQQPSWTRISPIGFGPKGGGGSQSTAYDAATDRLIVFGGFDPVASPCCAEPNDVWVLINATGSGGTPTWELLNPSAPVGLPQGRQAHSAVYDPATNRMIIFGGGRFSGFHFGVLFQDVWVLTHANNLGGTPEWIPLAPSGGPPAPREGHAAFYRQATNEMFVFGGGDNGILSVPNDLWVLEDANGIGTPTWVQLPETGDIPGPLQNFAFAYDATSNRFTVAGGCCFYTNASRILALDAFWKLPEWTSLSPTGTLPPIGDALIFGYDPSSNRLIVHGMQPGGGANATWLLTDANAKGATLAWVNTIPEGAPGSPPEGAFRVGSAYNPTTKKLIYGLNQTDPLGKLVPEIWILSNADSEGGPPLAERAAALAKSLLNRQYFEGAKGYDYGSSPNHYVDADTISAGYAHCDGSPACVDGTQASHAPGIDCSGLILWAYNTAAGATTRYLDSNPIQYEGAAGQCSDSQSQLLNVSTLSDLQPGDLLCFQYHFPSKVNPAILGEVSGHVAMYVGDAEAVEAYLPGTGVIASSLIPDAQGHMRVTYDSQANWPVCSSPEAARCFDFLGYRRPNPKAQVGLSVATHSPISLGVTDPDGFTINPQISTVTEREVLREVPGQLYYVEDSNSDDTVIAPILKVGAYLIKVMTKPGASAADTYSLNIEAAGNTLSLAKDVPINTIPSSGYGFVSTGTAISVFIPVAIDIKPGETPNSINPKSHGKVPVAILSSPTFDAVAQIDQTLLTFGHSGDEISLAFCNTEDANSDGRLDLVCHFNTQNTAFVSGDTVGILKGMTTDGIPVRGTDSVTIVPK